MVQTEEQYLFMYNAVLDGVSSLIEIEMQEYLVGSFFFVHFRMHRCYLEVYFLP